MLSVTYQYPGDPILPARLLFSQEFQARNSNREVILLAEDRLERFPVSDVLCDLCNVQIPWHEPVCDTPHRLYCWSCAKQWVLPYLTDPAQLALPLQEGA